MYHVTLDGQGYVIDLASYRKGVAAPFAAKIRQGDAGYGDLAQASAWAQGSWRGGVGWRDFDARYPDRYDLGPGIDGFGDDVRCGPQLATAYTPAAGVNDLYRLQPYGAKLYAARGDGGQIYDTADGTTWATAHASASTALRAMGLFNNLLLVGSGNNGDIHRFDGAAWAVWGTLANVSQVGSISAWYRAVGNNKAYVGVTSSVSGRAALYEATTAPAFTLVYETDYDRLEASIVWDNALWFAAITDSQGHRGGLYRYDGSSFTLVQVIPDNAITSFAIYRNRLYAGSATRGKVWRVTAQGLEDVFSVPDVVGIGGVSAYNQDVRQLVVHNDRLYVPVVDTNGLGVYVYDGVGWHNLATGGVGQEPRGIASFAGTVFLSNKNSSGARVLKLSTTDALSGAVLVSSWFDAGLPSADKALVRLLVRHAPLASGEAIAVDYERDESGAWDSLGTSNTIDATEKLFSYPAATTARSLRLRIALTMATTTASPRLRELSLEYAVMPELKAEWRFDVLLEGTAALPLIRLDQSAEPKTGAELADTLWASRAKKYPVSYTDLDGETKTVYLRDIEEQVSPRSQRPGLNTRARVTLVEA